MNEKNCQQHFHTPVVAPGAGFCATKPGCKLFLLFEKQINLFPKYLHVLLKQRLPSHTDLNFNASKTCTKFWFDNVHLYSNVSISIDRFGSNLFPYTTKVIGLLGGYWWGFFWHGRFKKQQTFCKHSNLERKMLPLLGFVFFNITATRVLYDNCQEVT